MGANEFRRTSTELAAGRAAPMVVAMSGEGGHGRDTECVELLQWALPRLGLRWPGFRGVRAQVCKRLARRARELGLDGVAAYRRRLEREPSEWARLDAACRITISRFHRDRRVFEQLRTDVMPALVAAARARGAGSLACWSAGCASGEEPYTLAILHRYGLSDADRAMPIEIVATDAEPRVLERARRAQYAPGSLRELPDDWIERAFEPLDGELRLKDELREGVTLHEADLRASMPTGPFDLVLCRNLALTYFEAPLREQVVGRIIDRMVVGGALVIGTHETLPSDLRARLAPWPSVRAVFRRMA